MRHKTIIYYAVMAAMMLTLFSQCEFDAPTPAWYQDRDPGEPPVISSIEPPDSALAGITRIKVIGENFPTNISDCALYFNNARVDIIDLSSSEITVFRPDIIGEVEIRIAAAAALDLVIYSPYKVLPVKELANTFLFDIEQICHDREGNAYVSLSSNEVFKMTPEGEVTAIGMSTKVVRGLGVSSEGKLMYVNGLKDIYYFPEVDAENEKYKKAGIRATRMTVDKNGVIYCAGKKTSVSSINISGDVLLNEAYKEYEVLSIGASENFVYIAGVYGGKDSTAIQQGIWRSEILSADGELGPGELVLDWSLSGEYSGSEITGLGLSADGDLLVSTTHNMTLLLIDKNGTIGPYYRQIVTAASSLFTWGGGNKAYIVFADMPAELYTIDMGRSGY